ncbi:hypothetical protein [Gluconobacter potus]|nr:hypothetical protein [Gluconobacter potus]
MPRFPTKPKGLRQKRYLRMNGFVFFIFAALVFSGTSWVCIHYTDAVHRWADDMMGVTTDEDGNAIETWDPHYHGPNGHGASTNSSPQNIQLN